MTFWSKITLVLTSVAVWFYSVHVGREAQRSLDEAKRSLSKAQRALDNAKQTHSLTERQSQIVLKTLDDHELVLERITAPLKALPQVRNDQG